jgi:adenine-specific DNA-methyltransferase
MFEQLAISVASSEVPVPEGLDWRKRHGVHYTPSALAEFVARRVVRQLDEQENVVLDPACGDGELLLAVALEASRNGLPAPQLVGVDRDRDAIAIARERLLEAPSASVSLRCGDFLEASGSDVDDRYDAVVSNPPYVRTQVLGAARAQELARKFGLTGRVDLYHAFVAAMTTRLTTDGVLGLLCSNRFLTTKGGESLRSLLIAHYDVIELWDLGDTKLFDAAVLPAVLVARRGIAVNDVAADYVRVYEDNNPPDSCRTETDLLSALEGGLHGFVQVGDRSFNVERGRLVKSTTGRPWRLSTSSSSRWLADVRKHSAGRLSDFGPIRVGIKTTADAVFVRSCWDDLPDAIRPEARLLHPLLTHRVAARWTAIHSEVDSRTVLYPHEIREGRRQPVDLARFPRTAAYLEQHRSRLEGRDYVRRAGRAWYEIWVPQQPHVWAAQKLVWPDISDKPRFFLDASGAIVNGDCYWLSCPDRSDEEIALALAVANSSFALRFYDLCSGNRLYAGRRRFITQYLEELPLPEATTSQLRDIVALITNLRHPQASDPERTMRLENLVDEAVAELFGVEKALREP